MSLRVQSLDSGIKMRGRKECNNNGSVWLDGKFIESLVDESKKEWAQ